MTIVWILCLVALPGMVAGLYAARQLLGYFITNEHEIRWPLDPVFVPLEVIDLEILLAKLVFSVFFLLFLVVFYRNFLQLSYPIKMFSSLLLIAQLMLMFPLIRHMLAGIHII